MAPTEDWKKQVNWRVLALFPLVPVGIAVAMLPTLLHALDFGDATITVSQLAAGEKPSSTNVRITEGRALYQSAYQLTTTRDGSVERVEQFVPVVPLTWQPGQPVPLVIHVERGIAYDSQIDPNVARAETFTGIARTILWEGIGSGERAVFANDLHVPLAENAVLLDADPSKYLFYLYSGAPLLAALIMGYIAYTMIKMARDNHASAVEFDKKFEASRAAYAAKHASADDDDDDDDEDEDEDED